VATQLLPTYLTCTEGSSNKFYIVCDLQDGKALIGYGANRQGIAGTWAVKPLAEALKKRREKDSKGYQIADDMSVPRDAKVELLNQVKRHFGSAATFEIGGQISVDVGSAPIGPVTARPKRAKSSKDRINVWL